MDDVTRAMSKGGVLVVICVKFRANQPLCPPPQPKRSHTPMATRMHGTCLEPRSTLAIEPSNDVIYVGEFSGVYRSTLAIQPSNDVIYVGELSGVYRPTLAIQPSKDAIHVICTGVVWSL